MCEPISSLFMGHGPVRIVFFRGRNLRRVRNLRRFFCSNKNSSSAMAASEWIGLQEWRLAAPPDERRRWGMNGPEKVAAPLSSRSFLNEDARISSLAEWGALVLATPDPLVKATITHHAYKLWRDGALPIGVAPSVDAPARPGKPELVHPRKIPAAKDLDISASVHMLHNLAHIELNAVDLAWDTVVRFSASSCELDPQFFSDFAHVADDESRHFCWCQQRLEELGSSYGEVPAHNLLWKDCHKTSGSLDARLAVIPMVQEARGLDAGPRLAEKLKVLGDDRSAGIVEQISKEEVAHVAVGVSWFLDVCRRLQCDPALRFQELIKGLNVPLKGPFNHGARAEAGIPRSWYDASVQPYTAKKLKQRPCSLSEVCERLALVVSKEQEVTD